MAQTERGCLVISLEPEKKIDEKKGLPEKYEILKGIGPEEIFIAVIAFLVIAPAIVILVLPPMLAVYYIALIVQAFRSDVHNKVGEFLGSVAKWLCIFLAVISVDLLLCMLIFGVTPNLKNLTFHGVSITRWIGVLDISCVFLTYSMFVYLLGYRRLQWRKHSEEVVHLYEGITGAINSVFYLLALFSIIRVAPLLKEHTILGHPTQKWVRVIIFLVLGHFVVRIFTSSIVLLFSKSVKTLTRKFPSLGWIKYILCYAEGLRWSFNFLLTSLLVLLTWILYFGSNLNRSSSHTVRVVYDNGFWTAFCILVSAFVLLVNRGIFLTWEARVVYNRSGKPTICAAKQLCFILIIVDESIDSGLWDIVKQNLNEERKKNDAADEKNHDVLPCAHDAMKLSKYLLDAEPKFSKVGYVLDFVQKCRKEILKRMNEQDLTRGDNDNRNWYEEKIVGDGCKLLFEAMKKKDGWKKKDLEKWIENHIKPCLEHVRKLGGELEWVHCLDNIMTAVLFGAVMIVWLFITGIATTKVVVLITSSTLAASFIFGESCKNLYQGIMFAYVKRPFEVGEICTIHGTRVMIRRIGTRRTICSPVDTTDEVIYPNTMLATVPIVKHKENPNLEHDPNPESIQGSKLELKIYLKLRLNSAPKTDIIKELISKIETYLDDNEDGFKKHPPGVLTKYEGQTYKIEVHFKYDKPTIESLDDKRAKFFQQMRKFLDELDIQERTGGCPIISSAIHESQTSHHERKESIS